MRTLRQSIASLGLLAFGATGYLAGCYSNGEDPAVIGINLPNGDEYRGGGQVDPGCEASPSESEAAISDKCGIFVRVSALTGGDGSMERPFNTLQAGLDAAKQAKFRVYACAEKYTGPAKAESVSLFGGFDCANGWKYVVDSAMRATIDGTDDITLSVSGGGNLKIEDVVVNGPDYSVPAASEDVAKSSIAASVNGPTVTFTRCDLNGRKAQDGAAGASIPDDQMLDGIFGNAGTNVCEAGANNPGGAEVVKMCPDGSSTTGGKGGDGGLLNFSPNTSLAGGSGEAGKPDLGKGPAGMGEPETGSWSCGDLTGEDGASGGAGDGAPNGSVTAMGYAPADGMPGGAGKSGQGGGGGGGAKGGFGICGNKNLAGASGSSGGTGGCGGSGGNGGRGGGASIGLLVMKKATVSLTDCAVLGGTGGNGGQGGIGQNGGLGGSGGNPGMGTAGGIKAACKGGQGGFGGNGGPGGGGSGGSSLGVAYSGMPPVKLGATTIMAGSAGIGGNDGLGGGTKKGAEGMAEEMKAF